MPQTTALSTQLQALHQTDAWVELYVLDCTAIGGSVYRFTPHFADGGTVAFDGNTYLSLPISSEGWEVSSGGTQPRPTLTVSNVNKVLLNAVNTLGDIVGAKLTRIRTKARFLDGGAEADPNASLRPDVFFIEQKTNHDAESISWQLTSAIERLGMKLPRRQIFRDPTYNSPGFPGVSRYRGYS